MTIKTIPSTLKPISHMREVKLVAEVLERLKTNYPNARCNIQYNTPFQLLIATILSTQSTEEKVNRVTPILFQKYESPDAFAAANRGELEQVIRPVGFYRQKAKFLQETSRILVDRYDGRVPADLATLIQLPGVARKTANMVLGEIYEIAEGISVDTHVHRVANRLGLSNGKNATKVENDMMKLIHHDSWIAISYLFMAHGEQLCHVRRPSCHKCPLKDLCPAKENVVDH